MQFIDQLTNVSILPPAEVFAGGHGDFDCHGLYEWVNANTYVSPIAAVIVYIVCIFVIIPFVRWRQCPPFMKHLFALWNLLLSVFSAYGVYVCVPFVFKAISERGGRYIVCSDAMMLGETTEKNVACYGPIGLMMSIFMLSKFPELLDTFFLVAMGKKVLFLHWYHHITVLLYSWFAYQSATPTAVFFGTMNYCVHAVMYFYFFASTYTNVLGFMRKPITMIQLAQMFVGVSLTLLAYVFSNDGQGCSSRYVDGNFFTFCSILYGSYFVLFLKFYIDSYSKKGSKKAGTDKTDKSPRAARASSRKED